MMFNVVYPIQQTITGINYNSAIKNYVKYTNDVNLTRLIIQNENLYRQSYVNYINKNGRKLAQINTIPLNPHFPLSYYIKEPIIAPPTRPNIGFLTPPLFAPVHISPYIGF
jgi:hypothetical protein